MTISSPINKKIIARHNNLLGLNEGDYLHLTAAEKSSLLSTETLTLAAGEDLIVGDPVYVSANLFFKADNVTNTNIIGVVSVAALTGLSATATIAGKLALTGIVNGTPYFLGDKVLTSTAPVAGKVISIGKALNTDLLNINIVPTVLLA